MSERLTSAAGLSLAAARGMSRSGLLASVEHLRGRRAQVVRVLTYHRVNDPAATPHLFPGLVSATPGAFREQAAFLAARYQVIGMQQLLDACRDGASLPRRAVLLTFDDAYRDFAEVAWPVLRHYGLPVTLFVPTAFPGSPERAFWWDRVHRAVERAAADGFLDTPIGRLAVSTPAERQMACSRLNRHVKSLPHPDAMAFVDALAGTSASAAGSDVLDWDSLRRLAAGGVTLGAHTQTHPLVDRVPPAEALREASGSLADLRREVGPVPAVFAYPAGALNAEVAEGLRDAGFDLAFTTAYGSNDLRVADPLRLRRNNVGQRTTLDVLRLRLAA